MFRNALIDHIDKYYKVVFLLIPLSCFTRFINRWEVKYDALTLICGTNDEHLNELIHDTWKPSKSSLFITGSVHKYKMRYFARKHIIITFPHFLK